MGMVKGQLRKGLQQPDFWHWDRDMAPCAHEFVRGTRASGSCMADSRRLFLSFAVQGASGRLVGWNSHTAL